MRNAEDVLSQIPTEWGTGSSLPRSSAYDSSGSSWKRRATGPGDLPHSSPAPTVMVHDSAPVMCLLPRPFFPLDNELLDDPPQLS